MQEDGRRLQEQGLVPIGFAGFRGGMASQKQLFAEAKQIAAEVVLFTSQYSNTESGVRPVFSYQPGQTYTTQTYGTANASAYGSSGYAYGSGTYSGYSTTTTPETLNEPDPV
jgi:serine protease Do